MNTASKIIVGAALAILTGTAIYEFKLMRDIRAEVALLQQQQAQFAEQLQQLHPAPVSNTPDPTTELNTFRAQIGELQGKVASLGRENASVSNWIAKVKEKARPADEPFVYADSTNRTNYVFGGYGNPQTGFQSLMWAVTQADARTFQASVTGEMAAAFAEQFKDLPDGVMPGGFKNGAMFKATGFRVLEETPLSNDEVQLKVFLEGSKIVVKPVFKMVGTPSAPEWKWARNE